ncbi:UDP-N-acetylenolpyruvoylglucosamine reductase, C-terminal domain protein, partial [Streptomyces ipomoeae 91-03]
MPSRRGRPTYDCLRLDRDGVTARSRVRREGDVSG